MVKERDTAIDLLKFVAAILITNSHFDIMYVKYSFLATGGTIGDVLFFFCSGFTLFLKDFKGIKGFPDWYKRRISRIYPSVFSIAIISCTIMGVGDNIINIIFDKGYWFLECIFLYYIIIYFIGLFCKKGITYIYIFIAVLSIFLFYSFDRPEGYNMYDGGYYKWCPYFLFMLLGAHMGMLMKERVMSGVKDNRNMVKDCILSLVFITLFYGIYVPTRKYSCLADFQVYNFIPLFFGIYYFYFFAASPMMKRICKKYNFPIRLIGGLCLEIYLLQRYLITDRINNLFPLNLILIICLMVVCAYFVRCFARLLSQTFNDTPYNWRAIVSLY